MRIFVFLLSVGVYFLISQGGSLTEMESISICLFIYSLLDFLVILGKKVAIMHLTLIIATLTCLVMPVVFYHVYPRSNTLANLWQKYMHVSTDVYFSFALPAVIALMLGIRITPIKLKVDNAPERLMEAVRMDLERKSRVGLILIGVGMVSGFLDFLAPTALKEIFFLMAHLTFVGVFYVIYSPAKNKRLVVIGVLFVMLAQSLATGMFGELVNILACAVVLIMLGKRVSLLTKIAVAVVGLALILLLQSVKGDYRTKIWANGGESDPGYYAELVSDRIGDPSQMLDPSKLFFVAVRANQGWLVAQTMYNVPSRHEFANGETIWQSIAAVFIPRIVWPDKPEAGGKANLKRFWGFNISGFSMNIGPMGEAYANFDVFGGIIYMFFYGFFFKLMLSLLLKKAEKRPTLVLWIPFLFFHAIGVETDLLTTMGSLVKAVVFTYFAFWAFQRWAKIQL